MKTKQLHNQLDTIERMHAHLIKRINVAQQGFTLQVYSKAVPDPDGKHRWIETGEYTKPSVATRDMRAITFQTGEGDVTVEPGDWIIRDALGEFYPCKPDIFAANFEATS